MMGDKLRCPSCGGPLKVANKRIRELEKQLVRDQALINAIAGCWSIRLVTHLLDGYYKALAGGE